MHTQKKHMITKNPKKPLSFSLGKLCLRFRIHILGNPSVLRICMIFLLYCTAVSFLLMGVKLFQEEQMAAKNVQKKIAQAASDNHTPYSVLYLPEEKTLQKGIAENVIRLHVIANSDSLEDQKLKLHVRDEIITDLQNALNGIHSKEAAEKIITSKLAEIHKTAKKTVLNSGYSYPVNVSLCNRLFPVKQYGDLTFPAGIYRALCIQIGSAKGHNWWCVLFPSLCFVNETTATVPEESKKKLKKSLTEEEYEFLSNPPEPHSLFLDWFSEK